VFRHTALFLLGETTPEQYEAMLAGLASLLTECPTVLGGDFGARLDGPREPWDYDVALHLDFADPGGYESYVRHPTHAAVSAFNASLSVEGTTQRVDWRYNGFSRVTPGRVRHCETFNWTEDPDEALLAQATELASADGVLSALAVADSGSDPRACDWILDIELESIDAARALLAGRRYRQLVETAGAGRTARITHLQRLRESG
jgi:Stress responsive A/B Barrel Domain